MFKALDISLIHDQLQAVLTSKKLSPQLALQFLQLLDAQVTAYTFSIQSHTHQEVSANNLPLFVHSQQFALIELLNQIYRHQLPVNDLPDPVRPLLEKTQAILKNTLDFIGNFFSQYANHDLAMPLIDWHVTQKQLSEKTNTIRQKLLSIQTSRLLTIALQPVMDAIDEESAPATYRMAAYLHRLTDMLAQVSPKGKIDCDIRTVLGYLGFNSNPFLKHLTDSIEEEIEALETTAEKISFLSLRGKDIKQIPILPNTKLYPEQIAAIDYVTDFIKEEIAYWQEYAQRETIATNNNQEQSQEKIHTGVPLSVLAAMLKVFVSLRQSDEQSKEQILRVAARTFTTRNNKPIPFGSIRAEFFSNSLRAGEATIDLFSQLYQAARQTFR